MSRNLNILAVDDTAVYRKILSDVVQSLPNVTLLDTATNGRIAMEKLEKFSKASPVDIVLLDIEMPEMNGLETLEAIKKNHPKVGVIMVSGLNRSSADVTIRALEAGAFDFVPKPSNSSMAENTQELKGTLKELFKQFRMQNMQTLRQLYQPKLPPRPSTDSRKIATVNRSSVDQPNNTLLKPPEAGTARTGDPAQHRGLQKTSRPSGHDEKPTLEKVDVLAIGVSTGGPKSLIEVIPNLPANLGVPVLLVQHMPPVFTASLASSLNKLSPMEVKEAEHGETLRPNVVYIAPGGRHMVIERLNSAQPARVSLTEDPAENGCRPAVDVLFRSLGKTYKKNILTVIMTGMGGDGMLGVQWLKQNCISFVQNKPAVYCISQSKESCVVYGMPRAVDDAGLSDECVDLKDIAPRIVKLCHR